VSVPRGILVVESRASDPSRQAEYDDWYANTHIPDVCAVPGFVGARRYRVHKVGDGHAEAAAPTTMAVYEIEADDLDGPVRELRARSADGRIVMSDVLQLDPPPVVTLYELIE
jgi:hypothetical protein